MDVETEARIKELSTRVERLNAKVNAMYFENYVFSYEMKVYIERKIKKYIERRRKICRLIRKWREFKIGVKEFFSIRVSNLNRELEEAIDREYNSII